jgi:gamma-glutamyl:cysteine ligase YbdK (ATP-grasp superfamily)
MTTQLPKGPIKDIITWQTKHKQIKQECGVAEMDTPGTTKDSREALHDTRNATDSVKDWRSFWRDVLEDSGQWIGTEDELTEATKKQQTKAKQKAVDDFLDTICCALEEMSGEEVFDCFVEAVQGQWDYTLKEHTKANDLFKYVLNNSK